MPFMDCVLSETQKHAVLFLISDSNSLSIIHVCTDTYSVIMYKIPEMLGLHLLLTYEMV